MSPYYKVALLSLCLLTQHCKTLVSKWELVYFGCNCKVDQPTKFWVTLDAPQPDVHHLISQFKSLIIEKTNIYYPSFALSEVKLLSSLNLSIQRETLKSELDQPTFPRQRPVSKLSCSITYPKPFGFR